MNKSHTVADFGQAWKIRANAQAHGVAWAAKHAKKQGINISVVRFALFGKY